MSDEYAEFWIARAKTPRTRARIRRLSRYEDISIGILLIGMGLFVLMILVSIVLGVWFWIAGIDRPEVFYWGFGIALGVLLLGALPEMIASNRLDKAKYADADISVGVVDEVTTRQEKDGEGDTVTVYRVSLTARLSDQLALRRYLEGGKSDEGEARMRHGSGAALASATTRSTPMICPMPASTAGPCKGGTFLSTDGVRLDLDDARALAGQLRSTYPHIDVLANTAGVSSESRSRLSMNSRRLFSSPISPRSY